MVEIPNCYFCGVTAQFTKGVIYVRYKVNEKWENVPICKPCYDLKRYENK